MPVVGRLDQYASVLAGEFDEITGGNVRISGLSTYYASEFSENVPVADGLVLDGLVLNFDAGISTSYPGSGTTWTDLSGNGNTGTLTGGPTYSSADGGSIVFDGTNDEVTTTTLFVDPQVFTISCWFKTSTASGRKIIGFEANQTGTGSSNYDRQLYIGTDGKIYFGVYDGVTQTAVSTSTLNDGNWHYIVGTYGGEGTTMRLYVDGISNATATATSAEGFSGYWRIASYRSNGWTSAGDGYFTGNISQASVYNTSLSAVEIQQNYNALAERYGYGISSSPPLTANVFPPYDLVYDDFGGTLFGVGQGRYMRQNTDKSVIVYNEIDEVTPII